MSITCNTEQKNGTDAQINAFRFIGFADTYDNSRPAVPDRCADIITNYLGKNPKTVVDLGCGTGLSIPIWNGKCKNIIAVEPSEDMLKIAQSKHLKNVKFIKAYSHNTGIESGIADVVICSQSFHWMEPLSTLKEVNRILKKNGIFATVDCDWPPVFDLSVESEYCKLFDKVRTIEKENEIINSTFNRWDKNQHLYNIKSSGYFDFARDIVFESFEQYDAEKFIGLALSQGGLQTILKNDPKLIAEDVKHFEDIANGCFKNETKEVSFCYRMRIGIKRINN